MVVTVQGVMIVVLGVRAEAVGVKVVRMGGGGCGGDDEGKGEGGWWWW